MHKHTVYVVDDDADVRKALTRSLSRHGYEVYAYASAEALLAEPIPKQVACLVLDVRMPGMNGLELQRKLLEDDIHLPIIFITGHGDIPMSVRAIKDGAKDFLEKPYQVEDLLQKIDQAIAAELERSSTHSQEIAVKEHYETLTAREQEVLRLLVSGASDASNKIVARQLEISHRTVDDHRAKIMLKMQARSFIELVEMSKVCGVYSVE
ncbi:MAG: response regulator [Granulosicoccaceae bacterium]